MNVSFASLGIQDKLVQVLKQNGLTQATPVQAAAIPPIAAGKDVAAEAQTGTGKTLAFVLPMLQAVDPGQARVQGLIVTPTRELALQITDEVAKLAPTVGATVLAAYGGQDVEAQMRKLAGAPHIVIGTPGRLLDQVRRGTLQLSGLSTLVLDEADQMLHMGFLDEVTDIIRQTPRSRQTLLFSATLGTAVRRLASAYMREPEHIHIKGKQVTLDGIKQLVVVTTDRGKQPLLIRMLEQYRPYLAVVFCRTRVRAAKLNEALLAAGFASGELHGDLSQAKREQVMKRFRDAKLQVLVATDVAARGIDVEGVSHVFNYDMPRDGESYIHRIGRTGRAGQTGLAVTLATGRDGETVRRIEQAIGIALKRRSMEDYGFPAAGAASGEALTETSGYGGGLVRPRRGSGRVAAGNALSAGGGGRAGRSRTDAGAGRSRGERDAERTRSAGGRSTRGAAEQARPGRAAKTAAGGKTGAAGKPKPDKRAASPGGRRKGGASRQGGRGRTK